MQALTVEQTIYQAESAVLPPTDAYRILAVLSGQGILTWDEKQIQLSPGAVLILPPPTEVSLSRMQALTTVQAAFAPEALVPPGADLWSCAGFRALFLQKRGKKISPVALESQGEDGERIRFALLAAEEELRERRAGYKTCAVAHMLTLLTVLSRLHVPDEIVREEHPEGLDRVLKWMEAHYTEDISMDNLAGLAGMSPRHLDRLFLEAFGLPPKKYMVRLRIDRACALLRTTDKTVTDIAFECGYTDSNYFARVFGKTRGMSPQQYRRGRTEA